MPGGKADGPGGQGAGPATSGESGTRHVTRDGAGQILPHCGQGGGGRSGRGGDADPGGAGGALRRREKDRGVVQDGMRCCPFQAPVPGKAGRGTPGIPPRRRMGPYMSPEFPGIPGVGEQLHWIKPIFDF